MPEAEIPIWLRPGYVDPALHEYIGKFRAYQAWVDGGPFTKDAEQIKAMLDRAEKQGVRQ